MWRLPLLALLIGSLACAVPSFDEVRRGNTSEAKLLDRNGEVIHELRVDRQIRRLAWTPIEKISPSLQALVTLAEDKRFHQHRGVDWRAVASSLWRRMIGKGKRGASTITMQVVSLLDPSLRPKGRRRGLWLKWRQMQEARSL